MPAREAPKRYRFADLELDPGRHRLLRGKSGIQLSSRLLDLLKVLVEKSPGVVTHDELAERVWGARRIVTPENLAQHIAMLRRSLDDDATAPVYVEAVRGKGYRLVPEVRELSAVRPARSHLLPVLFALAALAAAAFVAGRYFPSDAVESPSLDPAAATANPVNEPQAAEPRSILVLPLVSQSDDPDDQYFADGLTDELINRLSNRLSRPGDFLVLGRTSSFALKDVSATPQEIGERTRASHLLMGNVRRTDGNWEVELQLLRTADGVRVWSQPFDSIANIETKIADFLHAATRSGPLEDEFYYLPGTTDRRARDLYFRALGLDQSGGTADLLRAEELLREAIDIDPEFVAARGILARTLGKLRFRIPERADELLDEWHELVEHIMSTAPGHQITNFGRGLQLANAGDWAGAERAMTTALEMTPDGRLYREGKSLMSHVMRVTGRYELALADLTMTARQEPLALDISTIIQEVLYATGRLEEAEDEYYRSRDLPGDRRYVEAAALLRAVVENLGDTAVQARVERLAATYPGGVPSVRRLIEVLGDRQAALSLLEEQFERTDSDRMADVYIAWWADYLEDTDLALAALRRYFERTSRVTSNLWTAFLRNTRKDPGFKELVTDFGLLDYWRDTGDWGDFCRPVGAADFECR